MEKNCTICHARYSVTPKVFAKSKFCSNKCRFQSYHLSDVHKVCKTCGQTFIRKKNELKAAKKGSYCSPGCYEARSPQQLVRCECGKEFMAYASRVKYYNKLYCSNDCKYKYQLTGTLTDVPVERNNYQKFVAKLRHTARYHLWKKACLERDGFSCGCGEVTRLTVHHKVEVLDFVKKYGMDREKIEADPMFFDVGNGITLCRSCHFGKHHRISNE